MATLRDTERKEIVQRLACFETPTEVAEWASEEYGKDVTANQVHHYDPTRSDDTAQKWEALFQETREAFLNDLDTIPLSHRAVRLQELNRLYERAKEQEQLQEAARMLKQAAKEVGGAFTNETELSGKDGGPIEIKRDVKLSDAELAQIAAEHE
jgi:hypothetical protein